MDGDQERDRDVSYEGGVEGQQAYAPSLYAVSSFSMGCSAPSLSSLFAPLGTLRTQDFVEFPWLGHESQRGHFLL